MPIEARQITSELKTNLKHQFLKSVRPITKADTLIHENIVGTHIQ